MVQVDPASSAIRGAVLGGEYGMKAAGILIIASCIIYTALKAARHEVSKKPLFMVPIGIGLAALVVLPVVLAVAKVAKDLSQEIIRD